ncbi:hypothetical protein HBI88_066770 [Parastagonospora nodorum]|nr:hypothetical protein HBI97_076830 [Parastagonospora nodorum]KAH5811066.1 hypothetical protein HBI96_084280 [Parastagonospora nodorum]KAH5827712.1 hypothetical protein HBI94_066330 [Parastagonospora nodorum]KAH5836642.1 hypothetical protein HBI93_087990 [Parastagonospora nodorum]KAH5871987.1 hypothetical protein HBI91_075900 [Parastagonospora nodorum]
MSKSSLVSLPRELLRKICCELPCAAALEYLLVSRLIYQICDDWTVWRMLVKKNFYHVETAIEGKSDIWKRYTVAAAKATTLSNWSTQDLEMWLPQVAASRHPAILSKDVSALIRLYNSVFNSSVDAYQDMNLLSLSSERVYANTQADWCRAQAAAFTLTIRYFSTPAPPDCIEDSLESVSWLPIDVSHNTQLSPAEQDKHVTIRHALANRAVGIICARLRIHFAAMESTEGFHEPPSALSIPLSSLMSLPLPFTHNSLEAFSRCHLGVMTRLEFFTHCTWTGCHGIMNSPSRPFAAIGGPHRDGFPHEGGLDPMGYFPYGRSFESLVRFEMVEADEARLVLRSNNFHSEAGLHKIFLDVERSTGQIAVQYWHPAKVDLIPMDGIITPFGIMINYNSPGMWLWLWKTEWSEPAR